MTPALLAALVWLRPQLPALEEHLAALVDVNSFTENPEGGQQVGALLRDLFSMPELSSTRVPSASGRYADHLVLRTAAPGPPLLLVGHLDTVFPPGTFAGYRRDGEKRRGPGVLDMKGGLVVIAYALRALATEGLLEKIPLRVVIVADEEVGSPEGASVIREAAIGAREGLVFEAGRIGDAIITRRKGVASLHVEARGIGAHAGNDHAKGANALWALARFVDEAQRKTEYASGRTVNVGRMSGGTTRNTVPEQAEAWLDLRFESAADEALLFSYLEQAARLAERAVPGTRLSLRRGPSRPPLERNPVSLALAERYGECARLEGLGSAESPLVGGGSDANTLAALGVATIDGLGPRGKGFHTVDEQIEVATLIPKAAALVRLLASAAP